MLQAVEDSKGAEMPEWAEALGWLKRCEMHRRMAFSEWVERARVQLAVEQRRTVSAQRLVAVVQSQVRAQAECQVEFACRLKKLAVHTPDRVDLTEEEHADAAYLPKLQQFCAGQLQEGAQACGATLEKQRALARWESSNKAVMHELVAAQEALRGAEDLQKRCGLLWAKHEELCKARLQAANPTASMKPQSRSASSACPVDLWKSEAKYRRAVAEFDRKVASCRRTIPDLCHRSADTATSHRPLLRQLLRDVLLALGSAYGSLAEALSPPAWPGLPQFGDGTFAAGATLTADADLGTVQQSQAMPELDLPALPLSGLVRRRGLIERPPKSLSMFRAWRPHHLLLTTDGYVHCFRHESDVDTKNPVWSLAPKRGTAMRADPSALKFTFLPCGSWAWRKKNTRVVRVADSDSFAAWETLLGRHWQWLLPETQQVATVGPAASARTDAEAEDEEDTDREGVEDATVVVELQEEEDDADDEPAEEREEAKEGKEECMGCSVVEEAQPRLAAEEVPEAPNRMSAQPRALGPEEVPEPAMGGTCPKEPHDAGSRPPTSGPEVVPEQPHEDLDRPQVPLHEGLLCQPQLGETSAQEPVPAPAAGHEDASCLRADVAGQHPAEE